MKTVVSTQIRIPEELHQYISDGASRLGVSQNAYLIFLLEQGKKLNEAPVTVQPQA